MTSARTGLIIFLLLFLSACASTSGGGSVSTADQQSQAAADQATREAEFEAERQRQEQLLAEDRARETAAREAAARQAEAERQAQLQAETRQASESTRESEQGAAERARVVARQQARIAELREQIAANNSETANLESANVSLREAITAAENLSAALTAEQQKYGTTDPATGQTLEGLSKAELDALSAELERLRAQAAALVREESP